MDNQYKKYLSLNNGTEFKQLQLHLGYTLGEGKGLIMPDDWDSLSEDEKERRLNGAISQLS